MSVQAIPFLVSSSSVELDFCVLLGFSSLVFLGLLVVGYFILGFCLCGFCILLLCMFVFWFIECNYLLGLLLGCSFLIVIPTLLLSPSTYLHFYVPCALKSAVFIIVFILNLLLLLLLIIKLWKLKFCFVYFSNPAPLS